MKRILSALILCLTCHMVSAQSLNIPIPTQSITASTFTSNTYGSAQCSAGHFIITVWSWTSGSYTVHIQAQDPASLQWYDIVPGQAISAAGTTVMKVFPGAIPVPNMVTSDFLPAQWRIYLVGASTPNMTISVGLNCKGLT